MDVALLVHRRLASRDDLAIAVTKFRGRTRPGHRVIRHANHLFLARETGVADKGGIAAKVTRLAILPEDPLRNIVDKRFQHLLRAPCFGLGIDAVGDVVRQHENTRIPRIGQRVRRDVGADLHAVAALVPPYARAPLSACLARLARLIAGVARQQRGEAIEVVVGVQVAHGHRQEFELVVAVMHERRRIHCDKAIRRGVDDPHGHGMRVEQVAETLVAALHGPGDAQLVARRLLVAREGVDQRAAAGEHRKDQQEHGAAGLPRGFVERGRERIGFPPAQNRQFDIERSLVFSEPADCLPGPDTGGAGRVYGGALERRLRVAFRDARAFAEQVERAFHVRFESELGAQAAFQA